jgi:hypothetical protein
MKEKYLFGSVPSFSDVIGLSNYIHIYHDI